MKSNVINALFAFTVLGIFALSFNQTLAQEASNPSPVAEEQNVNAAAAPNFRYLYRGDLGEGLNDPRLYDRVDQAGNVYSGYITEANRPYVDRSWTTYLRYLALSVVYEEWDDVYEEYTVRYNIWSPLRGQLREGSKETVRQGSVEKSVDISGCKVYRESVQSAWIRDYTSLPYETITELMRMRGIEQKK